MSLFDGKKPTDYEQNVVQEALKNRDGREMLRFPGFPVRPSIHELAQKLFPVETMPPGALPVYTRDQCRVCNRWVGDLKTHTQEECDWFVVELVIDP